MNVVALLVDGDVLHRIRRPGVLLLHLIGLLLNGVIVPDTLVVTVAVIRCGSEGTLQCLGGSVQLRLDAPQRAGVLLAQNTDVQVRISGQAGILIAQRLVIGAESCVLSLKRFLPVSWSRQECRWQIDRVRR